MGNIFANKFSKYINLTPQLLYDRSNCYLCNHLNIKLSAIRNVIVIFFNNSFPFIVSIDI